MPALDVHWLVTAIVCTLVSHCYAVCTLIDHCYCMYTDWSLLNCMYTDWSLLLYVHWLTPSTCSRQLHHWWEGVRIPRSPFGPWYTELVDRGSKCRQWQYAQVSNRMDLLVVRIVQLEPSHLLYYYRLPSVPTLTVIICTLVKVVC